MKKNTQNTKENQQFKCEDCHDTKELIIDSCDHNGEHRQEIFPCECTLKTK